MIFEYHTSISTDYINQLIILEDLAYSWRLRATTRTELQQNAAFCLSFANDPFLHYPLVQYSNFTNYVDKAT
jgi:hypothetical protein